MFFVYLMNFLFAISTTIGMTFIPLLVTDSLGMTLLALGFIEGSTEFISTVLRLVTGNIFDRIKNKKLLFIFPAILACAAKAVLFFPNAYTIISSKILERIGNGAFAAPRDAYIGLNSFSKGKGLSWLNISKTLGCIMGPLVVSVSTMLLGPLNENIDAIIAIACVVTFISFIISFQIPVYKTLQVKTDKKFNFEEVINLVKELKYIFFLAALFFLGRFNDGVIMIHLKKEGFPEWFYLTTISLFNFIMLIASPYMGKLVDTDKIWRLMFISIISLLCFNIFFSNTIGISWFCAIAGISCWGIQRAGAQIAFAAMIFRLAPSRLYGTAIGAYSLLSGLGIFISSILNGYLAQISFYYVFCFSAVFSIMTFILALRLRKIFIF